MRNRRLRFMTSQSKSMEFKLELGFSRADCKSVYGRLSSLPMFSDCEMLRRTRQSTVHAIENRSIAKKKPSSSLNSMLFVLLSLFQDVNAISELISSLSLTEPADQFQGKEF